MEFLILLSKFIEEILKLRNQNESLKDDNKLKLKMIESLTVGQPTRYRMLTVKTH